MREDLLRSVNKPTAVINNSDRIQQENLSLLRPSLRPSAGRGFETDSSHKQQKYRKRLPVRLVPPQRQSRPQLVKDLTCNPKRRSLNLGLSLFRASLFPLLLLRISFWQLFYRMYRGIFSAPASPSRPSGQGGCSAFQRQRLTADRDTLVRAFVEENDLADDIQM